MDCICFIALEWCDPLSFWCQWTLLLSLQSQNLTFQCVDFLHLEYQKNFAMFFQPFDHYYLFTHFLFLKCEYSIFHQKTRVFEKTCNGTNIYMNTQCAFLSSTFTSTLRYARVKQIAWTCIRASAFSGFAPNKPLHQNGSLNDFTFSRSSQDIDPSYTVFSFRNFKLKKVKHNRIKKVIILTFNVSLKKVYILRTNNIDFDPKRRKPFFSFITLLLIGTVSNM